MSDVSNSIGYWFEGFLLGRYGDLTYGGEDTLVPDFNYGLNEEVKFWIEAKVGNIKWGTRVKAYQMESFSRLNGSVVHALGLHNFDDAHKRLTQKTLDGRLRHLSRHADVLQISFLTHSLMKLLYDGEKRVSKNGGVEYCMIKDSTLNNVFMNRNFRRGGKKDPNGNIVDCGELFLPENYYGFSYSDYRFFESVNQVPFVRAALDPMLDEEFIDFFLEREDVHEFAFA